MIKYIIKQPDGSTFEPKTMDELRELAREGKIDSGHSVRIEGGKTWHPADQIQGLLRKSFASNFSKSTIKSLGSVKGLAMQMPTLGNWKSLIKNKVVLSAVGLIAMISILIIFSSGKSVTSYVDDFESLQASLLESAQKDDPELFLDTLEESADLMVEMVANSEKIIEEINNMTPNERTAISVRFMAIQKKLRDNFRANPSGAEGLYFKVMTNPAYISRFQSIIEKIEKFGNDNPFETLY